MKIKSFFNLIAISLISYQGIAQETIQPSNTLTIKVSGIKKIKGLFFVAVFNTAEDYENGSINAVKKIKVPVKENQQTLEIKGLEYGKYGIKIYHDINENEVLDKNAFGIPKEPFGFSNNAKAIFSAPDFEETVFDFNVQNTSIYIELDN